MKGFIKFIIALLIPTLCTWYASTKGIPVVTWSVLIVTVAGVLFAFRASILMTIGVNIYHSNPQAGIKVMRLAYKTRKLSPSHQLIFAFIILRNGEIDEAESIMTKATVIGKHALTDTEFKAVEFNRSLITWKKGDLSQAIVQMEDLYANGYKTNGLYGSLGSLYNLNKEYSKAIALATEGLEANSTDLVSLDNLGQAYIGLGMLDEALKVYEELIPMHPRFLEAYYNYGTILEKKDKLTEAKYNYETALTIDEKYLSTVSHDEVCEAIDRICDISIDNVKIEDIVYEGTTEPIKYDSSEELSDIESIEIDIPIPSMKTEPVEETLAPEPEIEPETESDQHTL